MSEVETPTDTTDQGNANTDDVVNTDTEASTESDATFSAEMPTEEPVVKEPSTFKAEDSVEGEKPTVPEVYELSAPEGMDLNSGVMKDFVPIAKELGLSQENAQKLVNLNGRLVKESIAAQEAMATEQVKSWQQELREDKDLGGSPENLKSSMELAERGIRAVGNKELSQLLVQSGLVNNKHIVAAFKAVGAHISEDVVRRGTKVVPQTLAQQLYPKSNMNP